MVIIFICQQQKIIVKRGIWVVALFLALWTLLCTETREPRWMTLKTLLRNMGKCNLFVVHLYQCFATWLVFGCIILSPSTISALCWALYPPTFVRLPLQYCSIPPTTSSKGYPCQGEVFTKSEAPVHFVLEVFDRIHLGGLWTPWQYYDCMIVESFHC